MTGGVENPSNLSVYGNVTGRFKIPVESMKLSSGVYDAEQNRLVVFHAKFGTCNRRCTLAVKKAREPVCLFSQLQLSNGAKGSQAAARHPVHAKQT